MHNTRSLRKAGGRQMQPGSVRTVWVTFLASGLGGWLDLVRPVSHAQHGTMAGVLTLILTTVGSLAGAWWDSLAAQSPGYPASPSRDPEAGGNGGHARMVRAMEAMLLGSWAGWAGAAAAWALFARGGDPSMGWMLGLMGGMLGAATGAWWHPGFLRFPSAIPRKAAQRRSGAPGCPDGSARPVRLTQ